MYFSVLPFFGILGTCCYGHARLTCHEEWMCSNGQGVYAPVATKVYKPVDEIGLLWLLERSSSDSVCYVIAVAEYTEVNWMGLAPLDTWFR